MSAALLEATGASAVAESVETVHERNGRRHVGWPVARWLRYLRRDPLRSAQLGFLREAPDDTPTSFAEANESQVESATLGFADQSCAELPAPWPARVRAAARDSSGDLPAELGAAVARALPQRQEPPVWWRIVRVLQQLLVVCGGGALAWSALLVASWFGGGFTGVAFLDNPVFVGFAVAIVAAALAVGWLIGIGCQNIVSVSAAQKREYTERTSAENVRALAEDRVVAPVEAELGRYREFTSALETALAKRT